MQTTDDELIVLLDAAGTEIGTAPKLASHHANTPLHKAFSCYIFDDEGRFLVTQRALVKKVWPGVWTNSVCGHPGPGESDIDAIRRRVRYEIGLELKDITVVVPDYQYQTPPFHGIIEHEISPVYVARATTEPEPNPAEVEAYRWMAWDEYVRDVGTRPDVYSYWAKDQLKQLADNATLQTYCQPEL